MSAAFPDALADRLDQMLRARFKIAGVIYLRDIPFDIAAQRHAASFPLELVIEQQSDDQLAQTYFHLHPRYPFAVWIQVGPLIRRSAFLPHGAALEQPLERPNGLTKPKCAQFLRRKSAYIPRPVYWAWDLPFTFMDQGEHEVFITLSHAYHEGFSCGLKRGSKGVHVSDFPVGEILK
ncbi:hypothetical protein MMC22_005876 [Lobaria immixta]|nr:hypothetical protein [Lobaria immixta]